MFLIGSNFLIYTLFFFVRDGYPRNIDQAKQLEEILKRENQPLDCVISLNVPFDIIEERISAGRWYHENSGRV